MKEEIAKQWIAELRDPKNKQGTGRLRRDVLLPDGTIETQRCCLGVLADMAVKAGIIEPPGENFRYNGNMHYLSPQLQKWSGMRSDQGDYRRPDGDDFSEDILSVQNDQGASFAEIADIIEREWQNL